MEYWDGRENLKTKPSVERRTERVINHVMHKYSIKNIGQAIEKIIWDGIWEESLTELEKIYPDIRSNA